MATLEKLILSASILYDLCLALLSLPFVFFPKVQPLFHTLKEELLGLNTFKSDQDHQKEVKRISRSVRIAFSRGQQIVLYRRPGAGHSARSSSYKSGHYPVNVADLSSILELDKGNHTVKVQAGVSYEKLCHETLKHGLLPLVVPEFKSITVGGAIQGIGIESSSWANGAVDESVIEATLVLGDGTIVSSKSVPDLWRDIPGSNGTLALVVDVRLQLKLATTTICVRYELLENVESLCKRINTLKQDSDGSWIGSDRLIDAVWNRDLGIVAMFAGCCSTDDNPSSLATYLENTFSPFFFQHTQQVAETHLAGQGAAYFELMPTEQYLFRFDRGGFWGIMALAHTVPFLGLFLERPALTGCLNHFFRTSTLYKLAMLVSDLDRDSIAMLQDVDVPHTEAHLIAEWVVDHGLSHLWLCPVKSESQSIFAVSGGAKWVS